MVATDNEVLHAQLRAFFSEKLSVGISSIDVDLVQTGILDSLALVELLAYLFRPTAPLGANEVDEKAENDRQRHRVSIISKISYGVPY